MNSGKSQLVTIPQSFSMCGSAQTTMKKHADKEGAEELTRMQDLFYKMEKDAMDAEVQVMNRKRNHKYSMIKSLQRMIRVSLKSTSI